MCVRGGGYKEENRVDSLSQKMVTCCLISVGMGNGGRAFPYLMFFLAVTKQNYTQVKLLLYCDARRLSCCYTMMLRG